MFILFTIVNTNTGDYMKKNTIITILVVLLIGLCTIAGTYAVIIDVTGEEGMKEIANEITLRDIFTDTDGNYNDLYYDVKNELNITEDEANILMDSTYIDDALQIVLESIVDYKANNITEAKLSNDEIYNLIVDSVNKTENLSDETKTRIINKSAQYKEDISDYVYDIEINNLEG